MPTKKKPAKKAAKRAKRSPKDFMVPKSSKVRALTNKQHLVIDALVAGKTNEEAGKAAGVTYDGVRAMLAQPKVRTELERRRAEIQQKVQQSTQLTAEDLVRELIPLLTFDIRTIFNNDGDLLPLDQWPAGAGKAVASLEIEALFSGAGKDRIQIGFNKRVRLWSKTDAADRLAKIIGAYKPLGLDITPGSVKGISDVLRELARQGSDVGPGPSAG